MPAFDYRPFILSGQVRVVGGDKRARVSRGRFQSVVTGVPDAYLTGITDLDIRIRDGVPVPYPSSGVSGGVVCYELTGSGPQVMDSNSFAAGAIQVTAGRLEDIAIGGDQVMVVLGRHDDALDCFDIGSGGHISGVGQLTFEGGMLAAMTAMTSTVIDGTTYVYAGHWNIDGLTVYKELANGQLREIGHIGLNSADSQGLDVAAIRQVEVGGESYLLSVSQLQDSVTCYRIGVDGMPELVGAVGAANGLPISVPTDLIPVTVDGVQYVIVAAAGSGSLSVLEIGASGTLVPVDHVIDELDTRFQSVGAIAVQTVGDQTFVVVGGSDDGLSLMTLLPGGRLLHLAAIADDTATALTNITAIALHVNGSTLEVFASGEGEIGITHLRVDLYLLLTM